MPVVDTGITFERESGYDEQGNRTYLVTARLRTNSNDDGPGTVRREVVLRGIDIGSVYQEPNGFTDDGARCVEIRVRADQGHPRTWLASCFFSSAPPAPTATGERGRGYNPAKGQDGSGGGRPNAPELREPEIEVVYEGRRQPVRKAFPVDADNNVVGLIPVPITNSSGFPVDPLPEIEFYKIVITISRNERVYPLRGLRDWVDVLNSASFLGYGPLTVRFCPVRIFAVFEGGLAYWRVTYRFEVMPLEPNWDVDVLDNGYHELLYDAEDDTFYPEQIRDRHGAPVTEPTLLNGDGAALEHGADPVYRRWRIYYTAPRDFNEFNFNLPPLE